MNNYERIKAMSIEEMAKYSSVFQRCSFCIASTKENGMTITDGAICRKITCKEGIKQWLESEVE